eukprot:TRINITY_DN4018_c1_g2_i3.p3 TRINITY_DN4018_c1_g2~~TRINITY_DN4018_c1_g2_i3.p3  ORF type:complete len:399 (-),score=9.26 TRINITY_DN4018_c1_g2_i3:807-2003(-)
MEVELQTVIILGFAYFLGLFVRGLTGFGSALFVFAVWTIFSTLGFNVATIPVNIVANLIVNFVISIPFQVLTKVCVYGDYGIIITVILPKGIVFILGAYILKQISLKSLELVLAVVMLVLVLLRYVELTYNLLNNKNTTIEQQKQEESIANLSEVLLENNHAQQTEYSAGNSHKEHLIVPSDIESEQITGKEDRKNKQFQDRKNKENTEFEEEGGFCIATGQMTYQCIYFHFQALFCLLTCRYITQKVEETRRFYTDFKIEQGCLIIRYNKKWLRHIPWLINAGIFAGLLAGMLSLPGPPLMYTFQYLQIPKNVVRANRAVELMLNPGIFIYVLFDLFFPQYWIIYVVTVITGILGLFLGNYFSKFLSTQVYYHVLMGLMFGTGIVLLLRGLGIVQTI